MNNSGIPIHKFPGIAILVFIFTFALYICVQAQSENDSSYNIVYAKKWSKVNGKNIYSDWTPFKATSVESLKDFKPSGSPDFNEYGSTCKIKSQETGYFHTAKIGDRWWIIDPNGCANISVSVTSVRQGGSDKNREALVRKYGSAEKWISETHKEFIDLGFNGTGSWSDVKSIRFSNSGSINPLIYTTQMNVYSSYKHAIKKKNQSDVSFSVFDPGFEDFADKKAAELKETAGDPNLLGHFSDNELEFKLSILDEYLSISDHSDQNYLAANNFIERNKINRSEISDSVREAFLEVVAEQYYKVVSAAIRKYDPNHLYLGSRLHGRPKNTEGIIRAIGRYADIISINYYGQWEPSSRYFDQWARWADKPVLITEFYTKGMDSGMDNISGAGWIVKTQEERGLHYENFCINLLQKKNCVGWHWFRYMDNDPTDTTADPSNNDSNKGLVDNNYNQYQALARHMRILNINRYNLIQYFDR